MLLLHVVWEHACLLWLGVGVGLPEEVLGGWHHHRGLLLDSILGLGH